MLVCFSLSILTNLLVFFTFLSVRVHCCRDLLDFHSVHTPRKAGGGTASFAAPSAAKETVAIRDVPGKGVFLDGSSSLRTVVSSAEQTLELIARYACVDSVARLRP